MNKFAALALVLASTLFPALGLAQSNQTVNDNPVRWQTTEVNFVVDRSLWDQEANLKDPLSTLREAGREWEEAGTHVPRLHFREADASREGIGFHPDSENNLHVIRFYPRHFPRRVDRQVLAITLLTRNNATGEIVDADIIIDGESNRLGEVPKPMARGGLLDPHMQDWQNTLTHELGHALGLTEDPEHLEATMYPSSMPGETSKRDLNESDVDSIQRAYAEAATPKSQEESSFQSTLGVIGLAAFALGLGLFAAAAAGELTERRRYARYRATAAFTSVAALLLIIGFPQRKPKTTEHGLVMSAHTLMTDGVMRTRAQVRTSHGVVTVERLGGRLGRYEQIVHDAPSGHELRPGALVDVDE